MVAPPMGGGLDGTEVGFGGGRFGTDMLFAPQGPGTTPLGGGMPARGLPGKPRIGGPIFGGGGQAPGGGMTGSQQLYGTGWRPKFRGPIRPIR